MWVLNHFSRVGLFVAPWNVAHHAPLSMGFSRQEYWSGLPCPPPGDVPDPGIKPVSLMSPALADRFFTTRASRETLSLLFGIHKHMTLFKVLRQPARKKSAWVYFTNAFKMIWFWSRPLGLWAVSAGFFLQQQLTYWVSETNNLVFGIYPHPICPPLPPLRQ